MKKNDILIISVIFLVGILSYGILMFLGGNQEASIGTIYYDNEPIISVDLLDGTYTIINNDYINEIQGDLFSVKGELGPVIVLYEDGKLRVIDETSPQNICQEQGASSSALKPITCLPNRIVILFDGNETKDIDGIAK
jgi:hypothetical protein